MWEINSKHQNGRKGNVCNKKRIHARLGFDGTKDTSLFHHFFMFKNVVNSLESDETPSYSASHGAPNYVQRS